MTARAARRSPAREQVTLEFPDNQCLAALGGAHQKHLVRVEQRLGVRVAMRGNLVAIEGGPESRERAAAVLRALYARLEGGEWGAERTRGESNAMAGLSVLAKALVQVSGKTAEAVKSFLKTKTNTEKLALRDNPTLKPVIAELEAKKKKVVKDNGVNTEDLLSELGAE